MKFESLSISFLRKFVCALQSAAPHSLLLPAVVSLSKPLSSSDRALAFGHPAARGQRGVLVSLATLYQPPHHSLYFDIF